MRHVGAAALALAALVTTGCTRDGAATATTNAPEPLVTTTSSVAAANLPVSTLTLPAPATTALPATAPAPPTPPPTTVPLDAAVTLASALDALAPGYHFVTTAMVGGQVAVTAEGDHIAGATQMTVTSGGTSTQYLVTGAAAWALDGGEWQQLDSTQGLSDPVGQLRSPTATTIVGTPSAATITAHYPNAALGLQGDGQAGVEFQLVNGQITGLRYASTAVVSNPDGSTTERPAEVTATITPIAPGTQITLPAADA